MTPSPPQPEYIVTEEQVDEWLSHWVEKYQDIGKEVKAWLKENSHSRPHSTTPSERDKIIDEIITGIEFEGLRSAEEIWRMVESLRTPTEAQR